MRLADINGLFFQRETSKEFEEADRMQLKNSGNSQSLLGWSADPKKSAVKQMTLLSFSILKEYSM
jgi:hypothetical protein